MAQNTRKLLSLLCFLLGMMVSLSCSGSSGGPKAITSGVRGVAYGSNQINQFPLKDAIITVQPDGGGQEIARGQADAEGRFEIRLRPGTYRLVPLRISNQQANARTITVSANDFTDIVIEYDCPIC